jgi:hypothetical protein
MSSSISGLRYKENLAGSTFKGSKVEYVWEFILDGAPQKFELIDSKWTGKKKFIKNGTEVVDVKKDGSHLKNFEIGNHVFSIITLGDKCELRIDNQSFTHLYNLEKNKNFFGGETTPTSKTEVVKNFSDNFSSSQNDNNNNKFFKPNNNDNQKKNNMFNFAIKTDDSKHSEGLKKFKFGPGVKPNFTKDKKTDNNNQNKDLLGFGDDSQNKNNDLFGFGNNNNNNQNNNNNNIFGFGNSSNNNTNQNNSNDIFGFASNSNNNSQSNNNNDPFKFGFNSNQNKNNNIFGFGNNNNNQNNSNDIFGFGSNANNNNQNNNINNNNDLLGFASENKQENRNEPTKSSNEQLADVFIDILKS